MRRVDRGIIKLMVLRIHRSAPYLVVAIEPAILGADAILAKYSQEEVNLLP